LPLRATEIKGRGKRHYQQLKSAIEAIQCDDDEELLPDAKA
jgi:hypothetical protein